jgi:hypothetical protein
MNNNNNNVTINDGNFYDVNDYDGNKYNDNNYTNQVREVNNDKKYQVIGPSLSNRDRHIMDNPLLPKTGVPLTADDFIDSTNRIITATNTNDVRFDPATNVWNVDPGQFYDNSGLSGIDVTPNSTKKIDLGKFNIIFERNKEVAKESQRLKDLEKLNALSQEKQTVSLYDLSLFDIIINAKNAWFNVLDDLLDQKLELATFTKDNRLFYLGLTIIVFTTILYIYTLFLTDETDIRGSSSSQGNVKKIYHIYQYPKQNK